MTKSPTTLALALAVSLAAWLPDAQAVTLVDLRNNDRTKQIGSPSLVKEGKGVTPWYDGRNWQARVDANAALNASERSELVFGGCPNGRTYQASFDFSLPTGFGAYKADQRPGGYPWLLIFQLHDYSWTHSPSVAVVLKPTADDTKFQVYLSCRKWDSNGKQTVTDKYLRTVTANGSWTHIDLSWNLENNASDPSGWAKAQVGNSGTWVSGKAGIYNRTGVNPHIGIYRSSMNSRMQVTTDNLLITY